MNEEDLLDICKTLLFRTHGHTKDIPTELLKQVLGPSLYDEGLAEIIRDFDASA